MDRVQVIKQESSALGGDDADVSPDLNAPIQPQEDALEAAGLYLQDAGNRDETTLISRAGNDMLFKDGNNPTAKTLTEVLDRTRYYEFLLENDPIAETGATDASYAPTYSSGKVTKEEWKRNDTTLIKSIDYTYTGQKLTTEVRKVFAANGTTIVAQVTWTYSYTGNTLTSSSMTRDV